MPSSYQRTTKIGNKNFNHINLIQFKETVSITFECCRCWDFQLLYSYNFVHPNHYFHIDIIAYITMACLMATPFIPLAPSSTQTHKFAILYNDLFWLCMVKKKNRVWKQQEQEGLDKHMHMYLWLCVCFLPANLGQINSNNNATAVCCCCA